MLGSNKFYVVRVGKEQHDIISKVSEATGKSKQRVTEEMIQSSRQFANWKKKFDSVLTFK